MHQVISTSRETCNGVARRCPICDGAAQPLFAKDGFRIAGCGVCRHRFIENEVGADHVATVYGDDYFFGGKAGYSDYRSEEALLRASGRRYAKLLRRFREPGTLLDVGAAAGYVLQGLCDGGWSGEGIEPNPRMARLAREELCLTVRQGCLEDVESRSAFDAVTMIQVAAHFVDPSQAFGKASELLRPGGICLVETWNCRSWAARFWGRHWHEYSPPSVLHWFTPESLRALAARFGLHQAARGRPSKWLNAGHARSLLEHKLGDSPGGRVIGAILRRVPSSLPIPYPALDLFWAVFRKESR